MQRNTSINPKKDSAQPTSTKLPHGDDTISLGNDTPVTKPKKNAPTPSKKPEKLRARKIEPVIEINLPEIPSSIRLRDHLQENGCLLSEEQIKFVKVWVGKNHNEFANEVERTSNSLNTLDKNKILKTSLLQTRTASNDHLSHLTIDLLKKQVTERSHSDTEIHTKFINKTEVNQSEKISYIRTSILKNQTGSLQSKHTVLITRDNETGQVNYYAIGLGEKSERSQALGSGNNGKVKVIQHLDTKEFKAYKIQKVEGRGSSFSKLSNKSSLMRFSPIIKEADKLKRVGFDADCIIRQEKNQGIIIMDLVSGQPMDELSKSSLKDDKYWLSMCTNIAKETKKAHDKKILHRDLKEANFMSKNGSATLIDFGSAHDSDTDSDRLQVDAPLIGSTPLYRGPEIIGGNEVVFKIFNEKTEVYALGMIYKRLLGFYCEEVLNKIKNDIALLIENLKVTDTSSYITQNIEYLKKFHHDIALILDESDTTPTTLEITENDTIVLLEEIHRLTLEAIAYIRRVINEEIKYFEVDALAKTKRTDETHDNKIDDERETIFTQLHNALNQHIDKLGHGLNDDVVEEFNLRPSYSKNTIENKDENFILQRNRLHKSLIGNSMLVNEKIISQLIRNIKAFFTPFSPLKLSDRKLSETVKAFIENRMLNEDPNKRCTVDEAIKFFAALHKICELNSKRLSKTKVAIIEINDYIMSGKNKSLLHDELKQYATVYLIDTAEATSNKLKSYLIVESELSKQDINVNSTVFQSRNNTDTVTMLNHLVAKIPTIDNSEVSFITTKPMDKHAEIDECITMRVVNHQIQSSESEHESEKGSENSKTSVKPSFFRKLSGNLSLEMIGVNPEWRKSQTFTSSLVASSTINPSDKKKNRLSQTLNNVTGNFFGDIFWDKDKKKNQSDIKNHSSLKHKSKENLHSGKAK